MFYQLELNFKLRKESLEAKINLPIIENHNHMTAREQVELIFKLTLHSQRQKESCKIGFDSGQKQFPPPIPSKGSHLLK